MSDSKSLERQNLIFPSIHLARILQLYSLVVSSAIHRVTTYERPFFIEAPDVEASVMRAEFDRFLDQAILKL